MCIRIPKYDGGLKDITFNNKQVRPEDSGKGVTGVLCTSPV